MTVAEPASGDRLKGQRKLTQRALGPAHQSPEANPTHDDLEPKGRNENDHPASIVGQAMSPPEIERRQLRALDLTNPHGEFSKFFSRIQMEHKKDDFSAKSHRAQSPYSLSRIP